MKNTVGSTACTCGCGENRYNPEIVALVEHYRDLFWPERMIHIHRVASCVKHNKAIHGAALSRHVPAVQPNQLADAEDFDISGIDCHEVRATLDPVHTGGMELNTDGWVHLDLRPPVNGVPVRFSK